MCSSDLAAGMIRSLNYWEGGALWMGDQPLDWPQVLEGTQEMRLAVFHAKGCEIDEFRSSEHLAYELARRAG